MSVRRVFTYQQAIAAIPIIQPLMHDLKSKFIKVKMLKRRINALPYEQTSLADDHERAIEEVQKACYRILDTGVVVQDILHGLILFPFLDAKRMELGAFLYRDSTDFIDTWVNMAQANDDVRGDWKVSRFCTGIVNPIPDEWHDW